MIIYAVNVNTGGGRVLLDRLLLKNPFGKTTAAFLDKRYPLPQEFTGFAKSFAANIKCRLKAEGELHQFIQPYSESVLFFGNLPPLSKPKIKSYLYLQNCFLTRQVPLPKDSCKEWLRNYVESLILKIFYKNVDEVWVQTAWMQQITQAYLPNAIVKIKPFLPELPAANPALKRKYKFIYVGSLSKYKGLTEFAQGLHELDQKISKPLYACAVVSSSQQDLDQYIATLPEFKNIKIEFKCSVQRENLFKIYENTEYLIVTSLYESFCLPIYEADHFGSKVLIPADAGYGLEIEKQVPVIKFKRGALNLARFI